MAYNGLTNLGSAYLAKCMANKTGVTFTKIKVGNGSIPREKTGQTTTDLYGFKKEVEILAKEQVDTALKLTLLLNNLDVVAGFYVKEMGIYIQDNGEEKLYWYINKDNPSYLPDKNTPSNHRYNLYLEVTPVETTVVNFTGQDLLADKKYVDDSIKNFVGDLPAKIKTTKDLYDIIENNSGLNFDSNLIFLNDPGTKTQGKIYFDKNKKGMFECIKTTTETTNSTTYFVDISNKTNSDRLANLFEVWHSEDYTQGYVKYSNGLLEQWGCRVPLSDNYPTKINLFKSFLNTLYSINGTWCNDKEIIPIQISADYKDSFIVYSNKQQTEPKFSWYAIGFWK